MNRTLTTILAAAATALSGTAGASCILVDGSTADRGACRSIYGETWDDDGIGDHQSLSYFNSIYKWSDDEVSWDTWSYEAVALRNSGGASLSARTFVDLLDHSEPPASVSTKFGTATYRGHATGVYALATPFGGNVGAVRSDLELTADFTGGELTGKFDGFSILLEAATGDGWQRIPASITVAGRILEDGFVHTDTGLSLKDGVVGSGQLDSDFIMPGNSTTWRVKRNQVLGLTPELPDLPEFSIKAHFVKDATETVGTLETISPLTVEQGDSTGLLSLSLSFGADTATMPPPGPTSAYTLAKLIPDPANTFKALSRSLYRDASAARASATNRFAIKSVASDGDGGFHVTYVIDGVGTTVHFASGDLGAGNCSTCYATDVDGQQYHLWSYTGHFDGIGYGESGAGDFGYFRSVGTAYPGGGRSQLTYGVPSRPEGMPTTGAATYAGRMHADVYDNTLDTISTSRSRSFLQGSVVLTADFADASLSGRIFRLGIRAPGESDYRNLASTTRLDIGSGRITGDGFTATLTGTDDDANTSLADSVRGFAGDVSGQFYGPNAREFGATFNAARATGDDDDWTMLGWFGGESVDVVGAHTDNDPLQAGVNRLDYSSASPRIVAQDATNRVTSIQADGDGGFTISYLVDGTAQTVSLSTDDVGNLGVGWLSKIYHKRTGARSVFFTRPQNPSRAPQGQHYNVREWSAGVLPDETARSWQSAIAASVVHGERTASASMPRTGTATYAGRATAFVLSPSPGEGRASTSYAAGYSGSLSLSADFTAGSVSGRISDLEHSPSYYDNGQYSAAAGEFTISSGVIQGNGLSGSLSGLGFSGTVSGAFYGPAANEAAGVMQATGTEGRLLYGSFGGTRQ